MFVSCIGSLLGFRRGDRIVSASTPRVAAAETSDAEPRTLDGPVPLDGFEEVLGAGGREPAARMRSADGVKHGRDASLVETDEKPD